MPKTDPSRVGKRDGIGACRRGRLRSVGFLDRPRRHFHRRRRARPRRRLHTRKLLSESPAYKDAGVQGDPRPPGPWRRRGNPCRRHRRRQDGHHRRHQRAARAQGERTLLVITGGFRDALEIGYQARPRSSPETSSSPSSSTAKSSKSTSACSPTERLSAAPEDGRARGNSKRPRREGFDAVAIVFMHAYRYPEHERSAAAIARAAGLPQVSASHECSALIKLVGRGDTTVVDAYLSPILARYARASRARWTSSAPARS